jgi:SAM-dependent methyltransferase
MLKKRQLGQEMAFGKIPAFCKYELFMERYRSAAEFASVEFAGAGALSFLDIGSGNGRLKVFCDFSSKAEWHGVEIRDEAMDRCARLGYRMHKIDIEQHVLPFRDRQFDAVAGLHILEHISNPHHLLREMVRVLRPGGLLVLGVPTKPPVIVHLVGAYHAVRHRIQRDIGRTCNAYSARGFRRFVEQTLSDSCSLLDLRGFRLFSARRTLPLEDYRWFYRVSTWFGRHFPSLTPEVNVIVRKNASPLGQGVDSPA